VSEIAVVGAAGRHRQGCWWGGACQLPATLLPRLEPPAPGFHLVRRQAVGRFRLAVFRASAPTRVRIDRMRLYRGSDRLGLFSFVQHTGPVSQR
jgi:hypothetical protein